MRKAGGVYTTAIDLAKFMQGLLSNQLFSIDTRKMMWEKAVLKNGNVADYGLGWDIHPKVGKKTVGHSGGRKAVITHFVENQITVIFLTNTYGSDPIKFVSTIQSAFDETN